MREITKMTATDAGTFAVGGADGKTHIIYMLKGQSVLLPYQPSAAEASELTNELSAIPRAGGLQDR